MLRLAVVSPAVFRFTACPVLSACGLGTTPSTRSTLAGATSHLPKCYQLTHKAFDLKGLQEARCGSADDAEVVPPEDDGCADDAEVVPPEDDGSADDAEVVPPDESAGLRERRRHG